MRRLLFNRRGNSYLELIITMLIIFVLIATLITVPPVFTHKQNLDYMARKLARYVEVTGMVDAGVAELKKRLEDELGIEVTATWDADYISGTNKVQLRDYFTLTLETSYSFSLFGQTQYTIPLTAKVTGTSEVYHK